MAYCDDSPALQLRLLRELAQRLLLSGLAYAMFSGVFSLNMKVDARGPALALSAVLGLLGAWRTFVAHRLIHSPDPGRWGRKLIQITAWQSVAYGLFVAYALWNVRGVVVLECLMVVGVAGTSSVSANLFAPYPKLDWLNVSAQLIPIYIWCVSALPRYGWLLGALIVIHAVAITQLIRLNGTHIRRMFLDQLALEAQTEDLRQARDAAQRAASAKMSFLANMSHEIRTPLNGILGLAEVLHASTLTADQRELLGDIGRSGDHLLSILNNILDVAKVTSGKLALEDVPFDLQRLIRDAANPAAALAEAQKLRFLVQLPPDLPREVRGDSVRIRQVLSNLLSNAVKFTPCGEVRFQVAVSRPGWICFEVADTGIGLSAQQQENLFQEFHQVDSSTTRRFGGTGLGLAISRRLVELMGGRLWVESAKGQGSTFRVELPLASVASNSGPLQIVGIPATNLPAGLRVLVVEDNPVNQKVTSRMVSEAGARVEIAENGRIAVERHRAAPFDIILMDCQMPELDGYEATALIRSLPDEAARVRIVGVTANAFQEDRERCFRAGMDGYVAKPLTRKALLEAMCQQPELAPRASASSLTN